MLKVYKFNMRKIAGKLCLLHFNVAAAKRKSNPSTVHDYRVAEGYSVESCFDFR